MLQAKSVVLLKGNPGILKRIGGIKIGVSLCVEKESYLGFRNRVKMRKIGRKPDRKRKMPRE